MGTAACENEKMARSTRSEANRFLLDVMGLFHIEIKLEESPKIKWTIYQRKASLD